MLRSDEILQMFGRAGRRGLDETGFVLITANELRLLDAHPAHLSRSGAVDWGTLLGIMTSAAQTEKSPFGEAVRTQERLFTTKPIVLGVEESLRHPRVPCGLSTDSERARHVRKRVRQFLNSRGEWQVFPAAMPIPLKDIRALEWVTEMGANKSPDLSAATPVPLDQLRFTPILKVPTAIEKVGHGALVPNPEEGQGMYGRLTTIADRLGADRVLLAKWVRRLTAWNGRQVTLESWVTEVEPMVRRKLAEQKTPVLAVEEVERRLLARVSIAELTLRVPVDNYGAALWRPPEREVLPNDCARCALVPVCRGLPTNTGTALLWRRLGLIDAGGVPTLRGRLVSFFTQGDGLAVAACLEDEGYPLDELIYDLANLDAGFRFCGDDINRWGGRMANGLP